MERNEQDIFDQLVREKLAGYTEPPEPAWIKNIHAKKNRVINLYHLYRMMLIAVLVGAGIFSSIYYFTPQQAATSNAVIDNTATGTVNPTGLQPADNTEYVPPVDNNTFTQAAGNSNNTNTSKVNNNLNTGKNNREYTSTNTNNNNTHRTAVSPDKKNRTNTPASKAVNAATPGKPATKQGMQNEAKAGKNNQQLPAEGAQKQAQPALRSDSVSLHTDTDKSKTVDGKEKDGKEHTGTCTASFDYYTSYTGEISFTNTSSTSASASMSWTFGDGDRSLHTDPSHLYPKTGTYQVTLHVKDASLKCEDSYTKTISFRNPNDKNVPVSISGILYAGGSIVKKGMVELFVFDDAKGAYVNTNTVKTTQTGEFSIKIKTGQRYLLRGNPTSDQPDYTATFWGNTTEIESASDVVAMLSEDKDLLGYNIDLQIRERAVKNEELNPVNPFAINEQSVLLLDKNNNIVSVSKVDAQGNFNFGNVAPGEYTIVDPSTGATSSKIIGGTGSSGKANGNIYGSGSAAASPGASDEKVTVFPNPANTVVNFGVNSSSGEQATIVIMNAGGVELSREQRTFNAGFNQTQYDLSVYPPGIYYVLIFKGNQQVLSNRLVKLSADTTK